MLLAASSSTIHRLEHNWQYAYTVGFLKNQRLPEDGLCKTKTCWGLQCIYMIFNFLIILKLYHYIVLAFNVISALAGLE
jgi:hypothetical protein